MSALESLTSVTQDPTLFASNPYALAPDSLQVRRDVGRLLTERVAFIDATTNPHIKDESHEFAVYQLDGQDEFANIGRAVEGSVMLGDWGKTPESSRKDSEIFEHNSLFFVVIDVTDPEFPVPAASLSVADLRKGPSETIRFFEEDQEGKDQPLPLPPELHVSEDDIERGLWDVMAVMAPKGLRGTNASAWAYHGLYKASQEHGVHRWIATMTEREAMQMEGLGIPFREIVGTEMVPMERPGKAPLPLGFHTINVDEIRDSMTAKITALDTASVEDKKHALLWSKFATMSRIALAGITKSVAEVTTAA